MSKKIKFTYNDENYELEFTRDTMRKFENDGYKVGDISEKPLSMIPVVFRYSFYANHSKVKNKTIDEIYDLFGNKNELIAKLSEMVAETVDSMFQEPSKNAIMWETIN